MAGGDPADVARARPHLEPLGSAVLEVGPSGSGHAAKALNNLVSATNLAAAAEALTVAARFGIDPAVMVEVLNASTGRSQASEVKYPKHVLTGSYDSGFAMDLMIKDLGIARALAESQGVETPVMGAAHARALQAQEGAGRRGSGPHRGGPVLRVDQRRVAAQPRCSGRPRARPRWRGDRVTDNPQDYIDEMARSRGYVLDYHKVMAKQDFPVLQAANNLVGAAYLDQRRLDRTVKELIFIVSLTVMRASKGHIQSHIRVALDLGLSPEEILEAIEISLPEAGIVAFQAGFEAWREVVGAEGLEPTVAVHEGGSGGS